MTNQVFTATEKSTGKSWTFQQRRTYGRLEFRAFGSRGAWAPSLPEARKWAQEAGQFRYDGEAPLVYVVG